ARPQPRRRVGDGSGALPIGGDVLECDPGRGGRGRQWDRRRECGGGSGGWGGKVRGSDPALIPRARTFAALRCAGSPFSPGGEERQPRPSTASRSPSPRCGEESVFLSVRAA